MWHHFTQRRVLQLRQPYIRPSLLNETPHTFRAATSRANKGGHHGCTPEQIRIGNALLSVVSWGKGNLMWVFFWGVRIVWEGFFWLRLFWGDLFLRGFFFRGALRGCPLWWRRKLWWCFWLGLLCCYWLFFWCKISLPVYLRSLFFFSSLLMSPSPSALPSRRSVFPFLFLFFEGDRGWLVVIFPVLLWLLLFPRLCLL